MRSGSSIPAVSSPVICVSLRLVKKKATLAPRPASWSETPCRRDMAILPSSGVDLYRPSLRRHRAPGKRDRSGTEGRTRSLGLLAQRHVHVVHPGMEHGAIPQRGAHRAVQAVFQIDDALPPHGMREKVAVEGGVLREEPIQRENCCGHDQWVEANLLGRYLRPVLVG